MSSFARLHLIAIVGLVTLSGCPPGPGPGADASDDGSGPVTDADTVDDSDDGLSVDDSDDGPSVVLGTHAQWKEQPEQFRELHDGADLPIVLGHQGLWMVVLAVRSEETLSGSLDLDVRLDVGETTLGELQLVDKELDPELDGRDYVYDIWLIVSDPNPTTDTAQVTVDLVDSGGLALTLEHSVFLGGAL